MALTNGPLERVSLIDTLVDRIESAIVSGELATDSRLPGEESLAESYSVSRPVVREALARLRERGYVETTNGRGTFVRRPSVDTANRAMLRHLQLHLGDGYDIDQLYEARDTIESRAAGLAAQRATEADLVGLTEQLEVMRRFPDDADRFAAADVAFHLAIAGATRNPLMLVMLGPLLDVIVAGVHGSIHADPRSTRQGIADHAEILRLITQRMPEEAAAAMRRHLAASRTFFPPGVLEADSPAR